MPLRSVVSQLAVTLIGILGVPIILIAASIQGGVIPGPLPLFPRDNWWNADIFHGASRRDVCLFHLVHRIDPADACRLRRRCHAGRSADL